jgi:hypothetical protein
MAYPAVEQISVTDDLGEDMRFSVMWGPGPSESQDSNEFSSGRDGTIALADCAGLASGTPCWPNMKPHLQGNDDSGDPVQYQAGNGMSGRYTVSINPSTFKLDIEFTGAWPIQR